MSKILIGIPTLDGPDRLERALFSVRDTTRELGSSRNRSDVTILVSDDCSSPENLEANKEVTARYNVDMLMTEERLGISKQWNRLVRHVPDADIVVLINDDIEVVKDWVDVLAFAIERNPCVGMVGLRSQNGTKAENPPRPRIDFEFSQLYHGDGTILASGGACFAFRRTDWEAVEGFDERYFCYYEELDFGVMLAKKLGRFNCIAEHPVVFHMVGATMKSLAAQRILQESKMAFSRKWDQSLDSMREELGAREVPKLVSWHNQWKYWRSP